jgi:hypothetical protein
MDKMLRWIGDGLRRVYPVRMDRKGDPLGAIARAAVQRHAVAREANRVAALDNLAAMRDLLRDRSVDEDTPTIYN